MGDDLDVDALLEETYNREVSNDPAVARSKAGGTSVNQIFDHLIE